MTQDFLNSESLVGYQIDVTHLHNVLQGLISAQQQQQQQLSSVLRKVGNLESTINHVDSRLQGIENALGGFGGADELRSLRGHLVEVAKEVDALNDNVIPVLQRQSEDALRVTQSNSQQLKDVVSTVPALERGYSDLRRDLEMTRGNTMKLSDQVAALNQVVESDKAESEAKERSRGLQQRQIDDVCRDINARTERMERELLSRLSGAVEELTQRTNENFREVENSAKGMDAEIARLHSELANLRAELNTVDNDNRHRVGKVTADVDDKFNVVLNLMQNFERQSMLMEQHLADAGRVLSTRDASRAPSNGRSGSMEYMMGSRPTPSSSSAFPPQAPSSSGQYGTNVRRNFSNELERGSY